jgi:peroxiredoxin Q/BCP
VLSDKGNKFKKLFDLPTNVFGLLPGRVIYVAYITGKVVHMFNSQVPTERHVDDALKNIKRG